MNDNLPDSTNIVPDVDRPETGGRRTRMREFQAQLMERMQAAQRGTRLRVNQLGIMIGQSRYLLDLREAGEIVTAGSIANVPLTKDWYLGLSNIRGNLTSVVDLARFEGGQKTDLDSSCRIVAFAPGLAFNSGLLVSQVLGLRNSSEMDPEPAEGINVNVDEEVKNRPWIVKRYRDRDNQIWLELGLSILVQDQNFLHVGL